MPLAAWTDGWDAFWAESFALLSLVLAALLVVQIGIVWWIWRRTRRRRRRVPLVIGGWGTRGKSGTERCKAALFHAYGANVVSKTTGCEAMIIAAMPRQPAEEIFLFRPMEKATIYEQVQVLQAAERLGCEVFLYECMALNPRYVEVLQDGWMHDDYGTLTNAYPDHEDVQGPAGRNVAEVIGGFAPRATVTWTCERQMLPILQEVGRPRQARLRPVAVSDAEMITDDVLQRLPYQEHPANLALLVHLAREFGVDDDFVLKEVADHLVPDLGVLRTFPALHVAGRELRFTNGMSANERLGALGNWRRLGFDRHRCRLAPQEWIVCVLNNRADRIPRSKVFAAMVAEDLAAHAFVLIGTNVGGLVAAIDEAVEAAAERWQVADCRDRAALDRRLGQVCERLKLVARHAVDCTFHVRCVLLACSQPVERVDAWLQGPVWRQVMAQAEAVRGDEAERASDALRAAWQAVRPSCLADWAPAWQERSEALPRDRLGVDQAIEQVGRFWRQYRQCCSLQRGLVAELGAEGLSPAADGILRRFVAVYRREQLVVIEDPQATGDQVIQTIVTSVPPGHAAHCLGMQNIKGTGLDFAYRWVALLRVSQWSWDLRSPLPERRRAAVREILTAGDWHYFDSHVALAALVAARADERWQAADEQALLDRAIAHLRQQVDSCGQGLDQVQVERRWYDILATICEPPLDVIDSIIRRVAFQRTLADFVRGRLARARTAATMQGLVKRQKGGWLKAWLDHRFQPDAGASETDAPLATADGLRPYAEADWQAVVAQIDGDALRVLDEDDIGAPAGVVG